MEHPDNSDHIKPVSWEELKKAFEKAIGNDMNFIEFAGTGCEYAPEIHNNAIIFRDTPKTQIPNNIGMNRNIKVAKQLIKIAKNLIEEEDMETPQKFDENYLIELAKEIRKKYNLDDEIDEGLGQWAYYTSKQYYTKTDLIKEIEEIAKQDLKNKKEIN